MENNIKDSPFHDGERLAQEITGEKHIADHNGGIVSSTLARGVMPFIEKTPVFFVSSMAGDGKLWASVLSGESNFVKVLNESTLTLDPSLLRSNKDDIFWQNILTTSSIGVLFIDLLTRRRYRINGSITKEANLYNIHVEQAYPNCPKYIQRRDTIPGGNTENRSDKELEEWVAQCDTFFIASGSAEGDLDVSHRGGKPGFIELTDNNTLRIPDYDGNSMFNTLGNFLQNPKAGLLFIDFSNGDTLQLSGTATVSWHEDDVENKTGGTGRFWYFNIEDKLAINSLPHFATRFIDYSPFNP
jgi:predicted pyridoxine 5'-phosphate oxidase superfamily flavin-nucleotide-binding protein